jgi:hypothetical protein
MYRWLVAKGITFGYRRVVAGKPRLVVAMAAGDVEFTFPGDNSFAGTFHGKQQLDSWLRRFASLSPEFRIHDVLVAGMPWNTRDLNTETIHRWEQRNPEVVTAGIA